MDVGLPNAPKSLPRSYGKLESRLRHYLGWVRVKAWVWESRLDCKALGVMTGVKVMVRVRALGLGSKGYGVGIR